MTDMLGVWAWYSIANEGSDEPLPVTRDELGAWFKELGLEEGFLPTPVRGVEAFRVATTGLADEWVSNGTKYRVRVRETERTEDYVKRQLFATWSGPKGPQERRIADLQFFRPRRTMHGRVHGTEKLKVMMHQGLEDLDEARLRALVERAKAQYQMHLTRLTPHAMRNIVRGYVLWLGGVSLRLGGGGNYFLPIEQLEQVRQLRKLIGRCGPQCRLMFTTVFDDPEQRDMLREAIEIDVEARAQQLVRDIDEWRRRNPGRAPTTLTWKAWLAEQGVLTDLLMRYADELEVTFDRAAIAVEQLRATIDAASRDVGEKARS